MGLAIGALGAVSIVIGLRLAGSGPGTAIGSGDPVDRLQPKGRPYGSTSTSNDASASGNAELLTDRDSDVARTIEMWREAILQKDADTVVRLDLSFREAPERYIAALVGRARSDANDRVRAFSTRELGKLVRAELAPQFERLLTDVSPYVRQNAAWALGELGSLPDGRSAAQSALANLRHMGARDPAGEVRSAARNALARLE